MDVVEVQPGEKPFVLDLVHPAEAFLEHDTSLALDGVEADPLELLEVEVVEVAIEALIEPPPGVEDESRDESARLVPVLLQGFRERDVLLVEVVSAVVAHAVVHGERSGEHRRVRGKRQRHHRARVLEEDPGRRHLVEVGRRDAVVTVGRQPVGSQGIGGDEHDVERPQGLRRLTDQNRGDGGQQKENAHGHEERRFGNPPRDSSRLLVFRLRFAVSLVILATHGFLLVDSSITTIRDDRVA